MKKNKKEIYFDRIKEFKDRFRNMPSDKIRMHLNSGYYLTKEASIAYREILEERGESHKDK